RRMGGYVWATVEGGGSENSDWIVRITPTGELTRFATGYKMWPASITAGPDGSAWFTTSAGGGEFGRIAPSGEVKLFGWATDRANGIAIGPDGNLWYAGVTGVGRGTVGGGERCFRTTNNTSLPNLAMI